MTDRTVVFPAPGHCEQRQLAFDAPLLADLTWPYFAISGAHDGPTLCLIAGIHGAEYPPIDAVIRFCRALDPAVLNGRVVGLPVANLPAFWERTPFLCPRDGKNPNRVFPGNPAGTFSEVMAHHLFETFIRRADVLVDLHGGDMVEDLVPFSLVQESGNKDVDHLALNLAVAFGLPYLVVQAPTGGAVSGSTVGAAAQAGKPALIAEAGSIGQLQADAVRLHLRGLSRVVSRLAMLDGDLEEQPHPQLIREFTWVRAERGGFYRKTISAGDRIRVGETIGQMVNLWGEQIAQIASPVDGVALFVTTSPAIADNGLLTGIGVLP